MKLTKTEKFFFDWLDDVDTDISMDAYDSFWLGMVKKFDKEQTLKIKEAAYGKKDLDNYYIEELLDES